MKSIIIVCLGVIISCDGYEYLYDQDDSDLRWLYDNQLYGHGYRNFEFNGDFDDYVPNSYRKSVHYPPIVSYHPSPYYTDDTSLQLDDQWNEGLPLYLTYEQLPRIQKKPGYFVPPTTEQPSTNGYHYPAPDERYLPPSREPVQFAQVKKLSTHGYHYPAPEESYLPPSKEQVQFAPVKKLSTAGYHYPAPEERYLPPSKEPVQFAQVKKLSTHGYHYPAPEERYLPPSKEPVPFFPSKKPVAPTVYLPPKTVYLPPKTEYLPPTRKPTTATPKTTIRTTTTLKPSTPKSLYLPPIVVPEPTVVGEYLPPPRELSHNLQPPAISATKPILFN